MVLVFLEVDAALPEDNRMTAVIREKVSFYVSQLFAWCEYIPIEVSEPFANYVSCVLLERVDINHNLCRGRLDRNGRVERPDSANERMLLIAVLNTKETGHLVNYEADPDPCDDGQEENPAQESESIRQVSISRS